MIGTGSAADAADGQQLHAEGTVSTGVQLGGGVQGHKGAVLPGAQPGVHVAAVTGIGGDKVLLAGVDQLNGPQSLHGQGGCQKLRLAADADAHAEAAAQVGRIPNPDLAFGHVEGVGHDHLGGRGGLCGGDDLQGAVGLIRSHSGMDLHLALLNAGQLDVGLHDHVGLGKAPVQCLVAVRLDLAADVSVFFVAVDRLNLGGVGLQRLDGIVNSGKLFILHLDELDGLVGDGFGLSGNGSNFVADVLGLIGKDGLVPDGFSGTGGGDHGGGGVEGLVGGVLKGADGLYAGQSFCGGGVDLHDLRMGVGAAQDLGMEHAGHGDVHSELAQTGGFIEAIVAGDAFSHVLHRAHSPFLILSAADMTASSIFT